MRFDVPFANAHSSVKNEVWNDYYCDLKYAFACETSRFLSSALDTAIDIAGV